MSFTHVHKQIRINNVEIKNRIVRSAHGTNCGNGRISDDLIAYHEARARGDVGLTIIELIAVHPTSIQWLPGWDPTFGDGYRKMVDVIRPHGMKLFQQIWHGGANGLPLGTPLWSASDIASPVIGVVPIPMTKNMIDEVVDSYAKTARRCQEWGIDGVEIHCAHGYLPAQFLSPATNRREDDYGGSFENRVRFILEVVTAVRHAVKGDYPVGVRVAPDLVERSLAPDDLLRAVRILEDRNLIDFVDVSVGNYLTFDKMIGGMHEQVGYELPTSIPISRHVKSAAMLSGRFRTLDDADLVIRSGDADMVVMTRATIADPALVNKSLVGAATRVRPCIGCNQGCVSAFMLTRRMGCVVNPAVGFEQTIGDDFLTRAVPPKKILVIGGGVAGMEASRVAALRGHRVTLAEAYANLGGTLNIASMAPTRHGLKDIAIWQENEVYAAGVDVRLNTYMDLENVLAENPDAVIIATGAAPRKDGIQLSHLTDPIKGIDRSNVISTNDLFTGQHGPLGKTALVIDDVGHYKAIAAAEELLSRGLSVSFITRHTAFAPNVEWALMVEPALRRMSKGKFNWLTRMRAIAIGDGFATIGPTYLAVGDSQTTVPADTLVFVSLNRPNQDLYHALTARGMPVSHIGDAQSPRFLDAAIREGYLAGAAVKVIHVCGGGILDSVATDGAGM
jgi:2,4-dienoyl-CoA reductase-like NADH-dependent reductase (Old Yellow Enzyme family)